MPPVQKSGLIKTRWCAKTLKTIFYCGVSLKIGDAQFYSCFGSDCENFSSFF
jgi:hypothetical protein